MTNVKVDFSRVNGKIKPMHATNNMVTVPRNGASDWDGKMQAAHIPYGRLHDTGGTFGGSRYVDIPNVFPDFDADENDPASYEFEFTDVNGKVSTFKFTISPFANAPFGKNTT